ncbi:putative reverse transcriptase zinc-binding domain-containing protein [Helianthus annuus]|nr:putative reverse transcriptase zinc-binding domain-containing protein [Helianthus annuus]
MEKLESLMRRFLWAGNDNVKKMHWVSWDRVALPKKLGVLGLCKLKHINFSLLVKWIWRFKTEEDSLWKLVVKAIHGPGKKWASLPLNAAIFSVWRNIVKLEEVTVFKGSRLSSFINSSPGNGKHTRFWSDCWIGDRPLMNVWPNLYDKESDKFCLIADRLKMVEQRLECVWGWSVQLSTDRDRSDLVELEHLIRDVCITDRPDKWKWTGNQEALFSAAAVRKILVEDNDPRFGNISEWVSWVPAKCGIFFWRALQNKIPTRMALIHRNIPVAISSCCFCGDYEETTDHIFTGCSVAIRVWQTLSEWVRLPPLFAFEFKDVTEFHLSRNLDKEKRKVIKGLVMVGCWCIWKARSEKSFSNGRGRFEDIVGDLKSFGFLWLRNRSIHKGLNWVEWCNFPLYML